MPSVHGVMMEWLYRNFDIWAMEEDDTVMGVMTKLYGPLLQYSLLFPSWKRSSIKITLGLAAFYVFSLHLHFVVMFVSTFKLTDHFDLASMDFHYCLIFGFLQVTLILVNIDRDLLARMHRRFGSDIGIYRTGRIYDEDKPLQFEKDKRKELMKFLCLPALIVVIAAAVTVVPYVKKLSQEHSSDESHYTSGGVNLNLPISAYYPFPTHTGVLHFVTVLGQVMAGAALAVMLGCMELLLFRLSEAIIFEFKVLQYGLESLFRNGLKLYLQMYPGEGTQGLPISDPRLQSCLTLCFKDCIIHHQKITILLKEYESSMKWPLAMAYAFGTGVIGLSLINILDSMEAKNYENLVIFTLMMIAEVLNMYMVSTFGENITSESVNLHHKLYDIDWHKLNTKNRKMMLIFQIATTNPVIVRAGGMVALCMDTFSSIMNTSYSFFNLVNANY